MTPPDSIVSTRRVALAGATGLVGQQLLTRLLADNGVVRVHALVRRPMGFTHERLTEHVVDFAALPALPPLDEVYLALGTTIKVAGSQAAFRAVDVDANLAVARAARQAGARRLGLVSAMGANARSRIFYNRCKGELEDALRTLGFEALVIARPSILVGDRARLGQPVRSGEGAALKLDRWIGFALPASLRPIESADVAAALHRSVPQARGELIMPSGAMRSASA